MYLVCLVFLASLTRPISGGGEKPTIYDLVSTKLKEGQKFSLNCILSSGDEVQFDWFLNGKRVAPNENIYINQHEDSSMINVRSMGLEQAGEYRCLASNRFGKDEKSILIRLEVKPKWINQPADISVQLGSELNIDCAAIGHPEPKIKLERLLNGNLMETYETGHLKAKYTKELAGRYRCTAENNVARIEKDFHVKHYGGLFFFI